MFKTHRGSTSESMIVSILIVILVLVCIPLISSFFKYTKPEIPIIEPYFNEVTFTMNNNTSISPTDKQALISFIFENFIVYIHDTIAIYTDNNEGYYEVIPVYVDGFISLYVPSLEKTILTMTSDFISIEYNTTDFPFPFPLTITLSYELPQ